MFYIYSKINWGNMKIFNNPRERTQTSPCTKAINNCVAIWREQPDVRLSPAMISHFQNMTEIELKQTIYL